MWAYLTTTDNPFDPATEFDKWYAFDLEKGYNTCSYLARIAKAPSSMSVNDYNEEIERAMHEICRFNLSGKHTIVYRDT